MQRKALPGKRGGQYLSIRYTERLAEAGIEPSVGSAGDSYALAETLNSLCKTGMVHRQGPWRNMQDLEMATLGGPYADASIAYRLTD